MGGDHGLNQGITIQRDVRILFQKPLLMAIATNMYGMLMLKLSLKNGPPSRYR